MWLAIDEETLQILGRFKYKRDALLAYAQNGKSKRMAKGLYIASDNNSWNSYETYVVNENEINGLITQGFDWLLTVSTLP